MRRWTVICSLIFLFLFMQLLFLNLGDVDEQLLVLNSGRNYNDLGINFTLSTVQWPYDRRKLRSSKTTPVRSDALQRSQISCEEMFNGEMGTIERARDYMKNNPREKLRGQFYIDETRNCEQFLTTRGYIMEPLSAEEADFPIAFSILMYKDAEQAERLLRAIYAPQNFYCIHVDAKAEASDKAALASIARCLPNVFLASRSESVYWGHVSIIHAEMNCLYDLLHYSWKYFINLSAQMFPLHTNRELVKILKLYDGANDIEGTTQRGQNLWLKMRHIFSWRLIESWKTMLFTLYPKSPPPHNVKLFKGSNQVAITRDFCLYLFRSREAQDLLSWISDTLAPDEYLWPTLNHNAHLKAPGAYLGDPETKAFTARASIWRGSADQMNWSWKHWECQGQWVRFICIFGVGDLPWLLHRPELFANKFFMDFEWLSFDCMEELIRNRTLLGTRQPFNNSYYLDLPFVKHKELIITH